MGEAARKALQELELTTQPVPELDQFEHIDDDGDLVSIGVNHRGVMVVSPGDAGMPVRLDQDAVNRLARYLDRHRTDQVDTREPDSPAEHWCGSDSDHAEHVSRAQGVPLKCLGTYAGRYGLSPDHLPNGVSVRNLCEHCGHAPHGVGVGCGESTPMESGLCRRCACRGGSDGA